jgi:cytochrome c556
VDTRFALVAKHLRGFDMAMVEVGHRYAELYWASRDRNWEYAAYQLGKIETAVGNGIERRPRRAASARMLEGAVTRVREAIDGRDGPALDTAIATLTATCNACHRAERVAFIQVAPPAVRLSPVRPGSVAETRQGASAP